MISGKRMKAANPQKSNKPTFESMEAFLRNCLMRDPTEGEVVAGVRIVERLPRNQYEKFESLMLTPGGNELELYERLLGKNTFLAAKVIADEYVARFGQNDGSVKEMMQAFVPNNRFNSWEDLDLNITSFCKSFTLRLESHIDKYKNIVFIDNIRFLLRELPHQKDYAQEKEIYEFVPCSFCWRHVPCKTTQKRRSLCDEHVKLKKWEPEYRRRKRLIERVTGIWLHIIKTVPGVKWVRNNMEINPQDFYLNMCVEKKGYLPHLAKHLASLQMSINSPKDVILALEHGVRLDTMLPAMRQAWEDHVDFLAKNFDYKYIWTIFRAEAWLQANAECKPRGRKAGRPEPDAVGIP
jgi:hypothetical protein